MSKGRRRILARAVAVELDGDEDLEPRRLTQPDRAWLRHLGALKQLVRTCAYGRLEAMQRGPLDLPADEFGVLAARVVEEATRYLDRLDTSPVRPDSSGAETLMYFDGPPPETGQGPAVFDDLAAVARHSRAGNGRFFGY